MQLTETDFAADACGCVIAVYGASALRRTIDADHDGHDRQARDASKLKRPGTHRSTTLSGERADEQSIQQTNGHAQGRVGTATSYAHVIA